MRRYLLLSPKTGARWEMDTVSMVEENKDEETQLRKVIQ